MEVNSRSYNRAKPSTLHGNSCVHSSANGDDFVTDVFSLSITVRPNHQGLCASGLLLQVLLYVLLVCGNGDLDRCFEEAEWITAVPGLEHGTEVLIHKMSRDSGDGILGLGLRVIEIIVLDELGGSVALGESESARFATDGTLDFTVVYLPPERICAIDLEIDGFSATHKTRMRYIEITVGLSRDASQGGYLVVRSPS